MSNKSAAVSALLSGACVIAMAGFAQAQTQSVESVVVTGSRVISDAVNSPTPLTVVSTEQLQATTPSTIQDGLNKLPIFQGSQTTRTVSGNPANDMNVLALRGFGAQRTLILLDGHRVPPSNTNGTTDSDVLPQALMTRVDVVTGGASAVYGSDAVTGVVNFILDKHFTGLKVDMNAGISSYGDADSYQGSLVAGSDLFGGRGHWEGSLRLYHADFVPTDARPYQQGAQFWGLVGAGTAASPFIKVKDFRLNNGSFGGLITCTNCGTLNGQQFVSNGVVGPFTAGTPTPNASISVGGDGAKQAYQQGTLLAELNTKDAFGRLSYDINSDTTAYVQVMAAEAQNYGRFVPYSFPTGANQPNTFFKTNAYLPAGFAANFTPAQQTFQDVTYFNQALPGGASGLQGRGLTRNLDLMSGVSGKLFKDFDWDFYYSHGEARFNSVSINNVNNQRLYAAEDAVLNSQNKVACYAATPAAGAVANAAYSSCIPINPFGPTAVTADAYKYFTENTGIVTTQILDDVGGSVSGNIFNLPAGPVKAALSAEMRWLDYTVKSTTPYSSLSTVDCSGLRLCSAATSLYFVSVGQPVKASTNVWEFAGEALIPVVKDLPLIQSFDINLAGRYTNYASSGGVQTWKIGLDWNVIDDLRLRGTTSIDIRAPTLNDLYQPLSKGFGGYNDVHTQTSGNVANQSGGNPNLVPEVARTYTVGAVFTPTFFPGFTASIDYYKINMANAIGQIAASNTQIAALCEASNGSSPYCALYQRPLPFSDHTAANFPTLVFNQNLNTAVQKIEGVDLEANYSFDLADLLDLDGTVNLRGLANYQPVNESQAFTNATYVWVAGPKTRFTGFLGWTNGDWAVNVQDRWLSGFKLATAPTIVFQDPRVKAFNVVDVSVSKNFSLGNKEMQVYMSADNIINSLAPLNVLPTSNPGIAYPVTVGEDVMGRYITLGVRARF